jgi:hypothetical protein
MRLKYRTGRMPPNRFPNDGGPATSAGFTHHSVIAGIIRKARPDCVSAA